VCRQRTPPPCPARLEGSRTSHETEVTSCRLRLCVYFSRRCRRLDVQWFVAEVARHPVNQPVSLATSARGTGSQLTKRTASSAAPRRAGPPSCGGPLLFPVDPVQLPDTPRNCTP